MVLKGDDMFRKRLFFGVAALFIVGIIVVAAQKQSNSPKSPNKTAAPKPAASAPKTAKGAPVKQAKASQPAVQTQHASTAPAVAKTQTSQPAATKSAAVTPPKSSPGATQKTDKPTTKETAKATTKPVKSDKTAPSTKPMTGATATAELTPVQQKLKQNTDLAAKVASRLPQGTDLMAASAGFQNLGQFVAAANVSNNLQISFPELKAKILTGMSLGQAIQAVRPLTASPTVEAQRAEYDARGMIAESEKTTTASSTVPSATPASTT